MNRAWTVQACRAVPTVAHNVACGAELNLPAEKRDYQEQEAEALHRDSTYRNTLHHGFVKNSTLRLPGIRIGGHGVPRT